LTLQTPFSGFKDRQVTQKRGPKKTGRLQNRREVVTKKEGKWQNTSSIVGTPPWKTENSFPLGLGTLNCDDDHIHVNDGGYDNH
jgi:hypothetical protein